MLHVQLAIRENQLGRFEAAIAHAELAIRAGQGGAVPYLCAAYAAARLPGNDGGLTWLDQALAKEPSNSLALSARAALLRTLGRDEEAVAAYASAVDQPPASASVLTDFAILLLELGRRDAGADMIERALIADRSHAAAWYTYAEMTTFGAGDPGIVDMERILARIEPQALPTARHDRVLLRYALAKAHGDAGNGPRSREYLDAGSRLKRAELHYDPAIDERRMAAAAAAFSAGSLFDLAGTHGPSTISGDTGNPRSRATASLTWETGPFSSTLSVNYQSAFSITDPTIGANTCLEALKGRSPSAYGSAISTTVTTLPSQWYPYCAVQHFTDVNLYASYNVSDHFQVHGSITNLFGSQPPVDLQTYGGGAELAYSTLDQDGAVGRFFLVGASYKFK